MIKQHEFSDVITDVTSRFRKIKSSEYQTSGEFQIVDQGKAAVAGYTDEPTLVTHISPVIVFGDHTRALKFVDAPIALGADGAKALQVNTAVAWPEYVYYFLRSVKITAAGYSRHFKFLKEIQVPIPYRDNAPDLEGQKRIAYLLREVEGLNAQRTQHLQQLDYLLKSVFLDTFGDPVRNEKGWDKKPFSKLLTDVESGKSPKCEARPAEGEEWGVLKLGAVTSCVYKEGDNKALPADTPPHSAAEVKAGDVLFSRKNTYELVAASAYVFETRPKLLLPDLIFRLAIRDDVELNPIYLWQLLISESQRRAIQSTASGAAGSMPNISKANLKRVQIPCPPITLQNEFALIVSKVENIKTIIKRCLKYLEDLFAGLSNQAFKGELDLSRVVAPEVDPVNAPENENPEVMPNTKDDQPFELPTPTTRLPEDAPRVRELAIGEWLAAYSQHNGRKPFSADDFLGLVQQKLSAMESEFDADWVSQEVNATDYDQVKDWVFQNLDGKQLGQSYDDEKNQVRVSAAKD